MADTTKIFVLSLILNLMLALSTAAYEDIGNTRGRIGTDDHITVLTESVTSNAQSHDALTNPDTLRTKETSTVLLDDSWGSATKWSRIAMNTIGNMMIAPVIVDAANNEGGNVEQALGWVLAAIQGIMTTIMVLAAWKVFKKGG